MAALSAQISKLEAVILQALWRFKDTLVSLPQERLKDLNLHTYRRQRHPINPVITPIILLGQVCRDSEKYRCDNSQRYGECSHAVLDWPPPIILAQPTASL